MIRQFFKLYLSTWWMPTVTSLFLFFMVGILGTITNRLHTSNASALINLPTLAVIAFLTLIWVASVFLVLIVGVYQVFKGNGKVGKRNIWLGIGSIILFTLYSFLGLAVT